VQRRHQKIIEEAPAPHMDPAMRAAMGDAAVKAARAVGYVGAGTVEFIVEGDAFHFMEMNTRLQVEHPVTEAITGQDLVEWQLRVAAGERLPVLQHELAIDGHAFEVRLYAEDPTKGFIPSVGTLAHLMLPDNARIESGVRAGDRITPDYDPMIAKLIVHGPDRPAALGLLRAALARCEVVGVQTNLALLAGIAGDADFRAGEVDTGFIGRHPELLVAPVATPAVIAAAALAVLDRRAAAAQVPGEPHSPWSAVDCWRMNAPGHQTILLDGLSIAAHPGGDGVWRLQWDGESIVATKRADGITLDGVVSRMTVVPEAGRIIVIADGINHVLTPVDPLRPPAAESVGGGRVMAPIPGRIASVLVAPGERVARGQVLLVLEAMKMEMSLTASMDGVVASLRCAAGDMVQEGVDLVTFEQEDAA
jgi:3-methylcrotonyl-CoA carboxylase alpha subunit